METYTWDEIYERADGEPHLSTKLKAKDTARQNVSLFGLEYDGINIEELEVPEDGVDDLCEKYNIRFDEDGNIVNHKPIQEDCQW